MVRERKYDGFKPSLFQDRSPYISHKIYYTYHQHMEKIPGGAKEEQKDYHNENFWGQTHYSSPPKFVG
jgi:hypothetical protein